MISNTPLLPGHIVKSPLPLSLARLTFCVRKHKGSLMHIRSIGHASLEIETKGLRLLTDPWWEGPAYTDQWHPWPLPQPANVQDRPVDYVYLSHGHEDHLHPGTLKTLKPGSTALVPQFLTGSMSDWLKNEVGFCEVIELPHGRKVQLRRGLTATCYVNLTDSMLVLEDGDRTTVVANDALHSSAPAVIDHFCRLIARNHGTPDVLFLGFAGASWFPNCIRVTGKDDAAAARARETLFSDNFLRVVDQLRPRVACAYAASFVLLEPHLRWINDVRLALPTPDEVYRRRRPNGPTRAHLLLPNDVVDGIDIVSGTTPRPSAETLRRSLETELADAAARAANRPTVSPTELRALVDRLDAHAKAHRRRLGSRQPFSVAILLRDAPDTTLFVEVTRRSARAGIGSPPRPGPTLETRFDVLKAALENEYGIESLFIGYGGIATLRAPDDYSRIVDVLRLASPREGGARALTRELLKHPVAGAASLWRQRWPLALTVGSKLGLFGKPFEVRPLDHHDDRPMREAA